MVYKRFFVSKMTQNEALKALIRSKSLEISKAKILTQTRVTLFYSSSDIDVALPFSLAVIFALVIYTISDILPSMKIYHSV